MPAVPVFEWNKCKDAIAEITISVLTWIRTTLSDVGKGHPMIFICKMLLYFFIVVWYSLHSLLAKCKTVFARLSSWCVAHVQPSSCLAWSWGEHAQYMGWGENNNSHAVSTEFNTWTPASSFCFHDVFMYEDYKSTAVEKWVLSAIPLQWMQLESSKSISTNLLLWIYFSILLLMVQKSGYPSGMKPIRRKSWDRLPTSTLNHQ